MRHCQKVEAMLDLSHLQRIYETTRVPLVLHGGSGIKKEYILGATRHGIAKINIGTAIRRVYQEALSSGRAKGSPRCHGTHPERVGSSRKPETGSPGCLILREDHVALA